jgi:hypothetical protein
MDMKAEETIKSRFFSLPAMAATEIAAQMVDLGDVMCRCNNSELKRNITDFLTDIAVTAMEVGRAGDYTYPVVLAEVKAKDGAEVRDGVVCVAPSCLCEAIKQLSDENPELMSHVRMPVVPLEGIYDLTKPNEELEFKAIVTGVCRGEGDKEIIEVFARYYIIRRAKEDLKFREDVINWLSDPVGRLPYGLAREFMEYVHKLGIYVRERAVREALYSIHLRQSSALLSALGAEVKPGPTPTITNCVDYTYVQSLIRKLGITDMGVAQVLCILTKSELESLLNIAEGECGGRLKSMLERGASAEDLRSLITECTEPEVKEVEVSIEEGKPVEAAKPEVRPEVGVTAKPETGEGEFELKPRTLIDIKVNCVGPNADETDECRATKAFVDFALGRSPPDKFLQLFDTIAPTKFPEPTGEDFVAVKGAITKLLRAYGVKNADKVAELYTLEGLNKFLDNALGGDPKSHVGDAYVNGVPRFWI